MFVEGLSEIEPMPPVPITMCKDTGEAHTYDGFIQIAVDNGGRLPTTDELIDHIGSEPFMKGADLWAATTDTDGSPDYVQLGDRPWAPGMSHNRDTPYDRPW